MPVTKRSLTSVLRIEEEVALEPGAVGDTAMPANFAVLKVEPAVEEPASCSTLFTTLRNGVAPNHANAPMKLQSVTKDQKAICFIVMLVDDVA